MEKRKITIHAGINANIVKVWEFYNEPKHITKWNFTDPLWHCPTATNDLRVGGRYSARMEAKDGSFGFDFNGLYIEVIEHEKIAYLLEDERTVEITFENENGSTLLTITFEAENQNTLEAQKQGWQSILDNFKKYVENKESINGD